MDTKMDTKMEMLEFKNSNQTTVNSNFNINQHQIIGNQPSQNQLQSNQQININPDYLYRNHQRQQPPHQQPQKPVQRYVNNSKVSKHRELPVDVPDSFVGVAKQSPRYPPPKPHRQVSPPMPLNMTTFNHAPASHMPYTSNNSNANAQQPTIPPLSQNTASNIITHNSSLRSSIKLQQLEKSRHGQHGNHSVGQPAINQAFELNEDDAVPTNTNEPHNNQSTNAKQTMKSKHLMPDLCSIYSRLQLNLNGEFADVTSEAKLAKLISIYNTIVQTHNKHFNMPNLASRHTTVVDAQGNPEPMTYKVSDLLHAVIHLFNGEGMTYDAAELFSILCKHEMDGVCSAFDRIAQYYEYAKPSRPDSPQNVEMVSENGVPKPPVYPHNQGMHQMQAHQMDDYDYAPDQVQMDIENNLYQNSMQPLTDVDLSDGSCTKTVRIEKSLEQALGATIRNDVDGSVVIGRTISGGAAHETGLLHEGDEILEVNGILMRGKNINQVVDILEAMEGTLTFRIVTRNYNNPPHRNSQEQILVRAFFDYDAESDDFIPCKELGLSFKKGDILAIIDQSDPNWWQAKRAGDKEWRLAGLIPSINFLKQREKGTTHDDITSSYYKPERKSGLVSMFLNCRGTSPRHKKKLPHIPLCPEDIPHYEEVYVHYPDSFRKRPIILVGPKMIGQQEIFTKLLQDSNRFARAISHTSKPMEPHERDGVNFHFVSRAKFEALKSANTFIEFGEYQNHYYGTTLEAMKEVVRSRKTCIHLVNTSSVFSFRNSRAGAELKPFFVFVKPDDSHPEKLRNIVSSFSQPKANIEEIIEAIMAEVQIIENHYLPYFDLVITVKDVESAYQELLHAIGKVETEQQWIPMFWQCSQTN